MLLRFIALHGLPTSEAHWVVFRAWKSAQLALPECRMSEAEGTPDGRCCDTCHGSPTCPKARPRT